MQWVTDELSSGRLKVGDHLPGERVLAETLQVSRGSLREALRVLEALGTIKTSTGSGPRSGTIITGSPGQALALALRLQLATSQVGHQHIYEMRILLETWAAQNAESGGVEWLVAEGLLDQMDVSSLEASEFLSLDAEFHASISRASGNPLISAMMEALRISIAEATLARAESVEDWGETASRLRAEHREILASLRAGESSKTGTLLRDHIRGYHVETGS